MSWYHVLVENINVSIHEIEVYKQSILISNLTKPNQHSCVNPSTTNFTNFMDGNDSTLRAPHTSWLAEKWFGSIGG